MQILNLFTRARPQASLASWILGFSASLELASSCLQALAVAITLDDYARFGQMLCNGGELFGERIIGRKCWELMIANHLTGLAVPFINLGVGHGFGLGVAVRIDDGLSGTLGTLGAFGWSGMATTYCRIDSAEKLVALCFAQHLPCDEHGLFQRFTNLSYQTLA